MIERAKLSGFDGVSIAWDDNMHEGKLMHKTPRITSFCFILAVPISVYHSYHMRA